MHKNLFKKGASNMNQYESNAFKDHMCQNCLPKEILFQCLGL